MVCDESGTWKSSSLEPHGSCELTVTVLGDVVRSFGGFIAGGEFSAIDRGIIDSGAQMCVGGPQTMRNLGITKDQLVKPATRICTATNESMQLLGATFVKIQGKNKWTGEVRETKQMLYIGAKCRGLFISKRAMIELGITSVNFPTIGDNRTGRTGGLCVSNGKANPGKSPEDETAIANEEDVPDENESELEQEKVSRENEMDED